MRPVAPLLPRAVEARLLTVLLRIDVPDGTWTTAVAFSPDGRFLIIVEAERAALYRLDLQGVS
jgi:sugar lactone lactonase YvrE